MNLYGNADTIEVGTTRTPAPAPFPAAPGSVVTHAGVTGAGIAPAPELVPRLDPALFANLDTVRAMVAHWSRDELYTLGNALMSQGDRRIAGQLVDVMRALLAPQLGDSQAPLVAVEFVTNPNYDDGVYWDDTAVWLHYADGTESPCEFHGDDGGAEDPEYVALDEGFRELLADYSRTDRPEHGAHLIVTLATGEFEVSGRYSLSERPPCPAAPCGGA